MCSEDEALMSGPGLVCHQEYKWGGVSGGPGSCKGGSDSVAGRQDVGNPSSSAASSSPLA